MSVINKMLKDLEQRQDPELNQNFNSPNVSFNGPQKKSHMGIVAVLSFVIIVLIGIVVWLYLDKSLLNPSEQSIQPNVVTASDRDGITDKSVTMTPSSKVESTSINEDKERQLEQVLAQTSGIKKQTQVPEKTQTQKRMTAQTALQAAGPKQTIDRLTSVQAVNTQARSSQIAKNESPKINDVAEPNRVYAPTIKAPEKETPALIKQTSNTSVNTPSFSIEKTSRVLTKEQRVEKLMNQAQKSFNQGYITESISQLKEVLASDDSHIEARNLLSVAWYGRGENQMAVTILNDGLSRYPNIEQWRLTAAKMFFKENNPAGAFSYLEAELTSASAEYYTMKGTLARQLQRFDKAESAYSMLTKLQPDVGNWWLGHAIALDSQSQSESALKSYKIVLDKGGVSPASLNFVKQRIEELQG